MSSVNFDPFKNQASLPESELLKVETSFSKSNPKSKHAPPKPKKQVFGMTVFAPENKTVQYIIIAVSLIAILLFWVLTLSGGGATTFTGSTKLYLACAPGQCPVSLTTGEKRCPSDSSSVLLYDPGYEVCTSKTTCTHPSLPYALKSDGSTDSTGVCESGVMCRCTNKLSCPTYVLTKFSMANGSRFLTGPDAQRYIFKQEPNTSGILGWSGMSVDDPNTDLCFLAPRNMSRVSPVTPECQHINPTVDQIKQCIASNPCTKGVLSVVTASKSSKNFRVADIPSSVLACVPGPPSCPTGKTRVFDQGLGRSVCV